MLDMLVEEHRSLATHLWKQEAFLCHQLSGADPENKEVHFAIVLSRSFANKLNSVASCLKNLDLEELREELGVRVHFEGRTPRQYLLLQESSPLSVEACAAHLMVNCEQAHEMLSRDAELLCRVDEALSNR
jgi:hypothetical protein